MAPNSHSYFLQQLRFKRVLQTQIGPNFTTSGSPELLHSNQADSPKTGVALTGRSLWSPVKPQGLTGVRRQRGAPNEAAVWIAAVAAQSQVPPFRTLARNRRLYPASIQQAALPQRPSRLGEARQLCTRPLILAWPPSWESP